MSSPSKIQREPRHCCWHLKLLLFLRLRLMAEPAPLAHWPAAVLKLSCYWRRSARWPLHSWTFTNHIQAAFRSHTFGWWLIPGLTTSPSQRAIVSICPLSLCVTDSPSCFEDTVIPHNIELTQWVWCGGCWPEKFCAYIAALDTSRFPTFFPLKTHKK